MWRKRSRDDRRPNVKGRKGTVVGTTGVGSTVTGQVEGLVGEDTGRGVPTGDRVSYRWCRPGVMCQDGGEVLELAPRLGSWSRRMGRL